ncbi:MAG: hypothetical protein AAGF12_02805 [Myxococcota bacterium]
MRVEALGLSACTGVVDESLRATLSSGLEGEGVRRTSRYPFVVQLDIGTTRGRVESDLGRNVPKLRRSAIVLDEHYLLTVGDLASER